MNKGVLIFLAVIAYGLICVVIAIRGGRQVESKTGEGFFLGGRSFGIIVMVSTVVMSIYSGLTFYGFPPMIMNGGTYALAATGFGFVGLAYPLIGYKLWKVSRGRNYMTTADFMRDRYESGGYGVFVSLLQLVFIVPYMTVQFVSVGNGLSYSSDGFVSFTAAIITFAIFTIVYLFIGGAKGVGLMDIFNALLAIVIPLVACFLIVKKQFGGDWSAMGAQAMANFPNMMDAKSFGNQYSAANIIGLVFSGMIALFSAPHIVSKMFMSKDRKTFQQMTIAGPLLYTFLTIPIVMMGILGTALYKATMAGADTALLVPTMMMEYTNTFIVIAMLWVLFAFALSTTNGFTFAAATIFSRDLIGRYGFKNVKDEKKKDELSVKIGKVGVVVIMIITVFLSMTRPAYIVDYAYAFATPGFAQILPSLLFGLYWKRASKPAAIISTVAGVITLLITLFVYKYPLGIHPVVWSLGVNTILFILVSFVTKPSDAVLDRFYGEEAKAIEAAVRAEDAAEAVKA